MPEEQDKLIEQASELILKSRRIVVFTGAGVSTESGIPDFRSPGGIWTKYDPDIFTYQNFMNDPESRKMHWKLLGSDDFISSSIQPNGAHYGIVELEKMGKLDCVITQNVDTLHEQAGNNPEQVIHLHGSMKSATCLNCGKSYPMDEIRERIRAGTEVPDCPDCKGLIKPDVIFFGERMPVWETTEAQKRCQKCDLCIVMGSSLVVRPASLMPRFALEEGARLIIINRDKTYLDSAAHVCIHDSASDTMDRITSRVKENLNGNDAG